MTTRTERALEELVAAQDRLLVAYRTGSRPSARTLDDIARLRAELASPAPDLDLDPGWLVACDESYYPEVTGYDTEEQARRAFAELTERRLYGAGGYLCRIVEETDGAPPQPPTPPAPGTVAEALTMPDLVRRRVGDQTIADRITQNLNLTTTDPSAIRKYAGTVDISRDVLGLPDHPDRT